MQPKLIRTLRRLATGIAVAAVLLTDIPIASASQAAVSINASCTFIASSNSDTFPNATDGNYTTKWTSTADASQTIDIAIGSGLQAGSIYFIWSKAPASWTLYAVESEGALTAILQGGSEGYLTQYVCIPAEYAGYSSLRLSMTPVGASTVDIAELTIFGPGDAPYYAPMWEPFTGRADLLTIAAHPDDEDLYLSVPAVTYAEQGMRCATAFMTFGGASSSVRRYEAQESVWCLRNKWYPAMGSFRDVWTGSMEDMLTHWPLDDVVGYIVAQIRRCKPSVIVTHDVNGEYGHGAHRLTEYAATLAFQYAGDASKYPDSAAKYGTWNAGKLYVHLYAGDALNPMDLNAVLPGFNGRTVLQAISDAYNRHDSQLPGRELPVSGDYDMRKFGLCATNLGADAVHDTMFENVTEEAMLRLNPWYIYETVDRSVLTQALERAKFKVEEQFTPESWAASGLPAAVAAAQAVMDNREAMQAQVDEQAGLLHAAMDRLEASLTLLRIDSLPVKLDYTVGEPPDLTGLAVTAVYSDGAEHSLAAEDLAVSGFNSAEPAAGQTVSLAFTDAGQTRTASFSVTISLPGAARIDPGVYPISRDNGVVTSIPAGTSAAQMLAGFGNGGDKLQLFGKDGTAVTGGAVATGMVIKLVSEGVVNDTLRLSVRGDVSGDGVIDINDILYIRAHLFGSHALEPCQRLAADVNDDGAVDIRDIALIRAHITGTGAIAGGEA